MHKSRITPIVKPPSSKVRVMLRNALALPQLMELEASVQANIAETASQLFSLRPVHPSLFTNMPTSLSAIFEHDLSEHFGQINTPRTAAVQSLKEAEVLRRWHLDAFHLQSHKRFLTALTKLNRILLGADASLRIGSIQTEADSNGWSIQFPPIERTAIQIEWLLYKIMDKDDKASKLLGAICSLPILTNSHLFCDGNGRVSRIVFNHMLHRIGLPNDVYLPVYEVMLASKGGFLIRLREAEIQNKWEPFISFILNFIKFCGAASNDL